LKCKTKANAIIFDTQVKAARYESVKTTAAAAAQIEIRLKPDIYINSKYNLKCSNLANVNFLNLTTVNLCGGREE